MSKLSSAFTSVNQEFSNHKLKPEISNLPDWFDGQVLRVGPAKFEYGNIKLNHWFDGLAMLYSFSSNSKDICFSNKYLESEQYFAAKKGRMKYDEFGTMVPSKLSKVAAIIKTILGLQTEKPSFNVNILNIKNKLLATSEVTTMLEFDRKNLQTLEEFKFVDGLKGQFSCAHPQFDPITKEQLNFAVDISKDCKYSLYKISKNSCDREVLYQFSNQQFIYNHTLFLTENYVVLYLGPLRANPIDFLSKPISEVIAYDINAKCQLLIVNRNTHKTELIDAPRFVMLHSANAFEKNQKIHLDFIEYTDDLEPYKRFYFENINNDDCKLQMQISRVVIDLENNLADKVIIADKNAEFARINENYLTKDYQFMYLANRKDHAEFFNSIIKLDLHNDRVSEYDFGDDYVSEPIFIASPEAKSEDDGLIFVNVIDSSKKLSYIVYLNAADLSLVYKAYLPIQIPPALHGIYLK
ncbi:carotenoid oxygenase family protein [Francisella sp. 19X1-34]|uniref:carotenoid oxygenase family protein n=1 Tax=Francisella sp. 19X1-34 TaxID=3087177 RepID=UPI002E3732C8|nr:carotenoid oxygenase family protein [Francisella sp. 19X1-34]MED7789423.1 carotenoid oxygenase family protein [Francisella sp. 19X1-34]